jgi:hypothetical protein
MPGPLVRSWGFNRAAEGYAPRAMREMRPFVERSGSSSKPTAGT